MKKHVVLFLAIVYSMSGRGQTTANPTATRRFDYYIVYSGVQSKKDVVQIETAIKSHDGVLSCEADRFPARFFSIRTQQPLSADVVKLWIDQGLYKIRFFGEGERAREEAILASRKP